MMKQEYVYCPVLLEPDQYEPDTINLLNDEEAFKYWLPCLDDMAAKFVVRVAHLLPDDKNAPERAIKCWRKFHDILDKIKLNRDFFKPLSVRTLLEYKHILLRDNNFYDAWSLQKERETNAAFLQFSNRVAKIDAILDFYDKWEELAKGIVAGNMFDWGAKAIIDILEKSSGFGLAEAMEEIQQRPWFCDDLNKWIEKNRLHPYKKAVIFVDNAGVDFVLGVLPFARQLLLQGTNVVLAANSVPALNDVTFCDLEVYMKIAVQKCPVLLRAVSSNKLIRVESGQKSPCLDLRQISPELSAQMNNADLIVLEGMGRAIHTNFLAKFSVDSIKLAVLKNEWLAKNLGAQQFSVVFKYDPMPDVNFIECT